MDKHPHSALIKQLGGTTAVAGIFDIKPPSVSAWHRRGIPLDRYLALHARRPDIVPPYEPNSQQEASL